MEHKLLDQNNDMGQCTKRPAALNSQQKSFVRAGTECMGGTRMKLWSARFEELKDYKKMYGDCLVPYNYPPNSALGTWVCTQRTQYRLHTDGRPSNMSTERITALDSIGFQWTIGRKADSLEHVEPKATPDHWSKVKNLHKKTLFWDGQLELNAAEHGAEPFLVDVCQAAENSTKRQTVFSFPKSRYSGCTEENWNAIHRELFLAARKSGFTIAKKASFHDHLGLTGWKFICTHGRCHQGTTTTLGKENSSRQSRSMCPMRASERCGWNIKVRFDRHYGGFVISACSGKWHSYHMKRTPESIVSSKFITQEEINQIKLHDECRIPTAATRRLMFHQVGVMLTRQQLHFLKDGDEDHSKFSHIGNFIAQSSAEKLLSQLEAMEDTFFIALIDDPVSGLYSLRSKGRPSKNQRAFLPEGEDYVTYLRKALKVQGGAKVLLAIVWTNKDALRYSLAFPERLIIDTTYKSNIEKRALFLGTGITSCNKTFIALQAYLPNERAWTFQWMFEEAIPKLLGKRFTLRNCLLSSDGDPEIYRTFLKVKETTDLRPNSDHMLCAFHLISQHYDNEVSSGNSNVKPLWSIAKDWMYSWITDCETTDEYIYSCQKFDSWLKSLCSGDNSNSKINAFCKETKEFVLEKLVPLENRWVRYSRLHNNSFDNKTTSVAESSNSLLKRHGMRPNDALHVAGGRITSIIRERFLQTNLYAERLSNTTAVKKSFFADYNDLTPYALKIITKEWHLRNNYASAHMMESVFYVRHFMDNRESQSPIPKFVRVRIITITNKIARCSCGFYARHRLPCRHLLHILDEMHVTYCGIRWMNLYATYYGTESSISKKLEEIQSSEDDGLRLTNETVQLLLNDKLQLPKIHRSSKPLKLDFFIEILGKTVTKADFIAGNMVINNMFDGDVEHHIEMGSMSFGRLSQSVAEERTTMNDRKKFYAESSKIVKELANVLEGYESEENEFLKKLEHILMEGKQVIMEKLPKNQCNINMEHASSYTGIVSSNLPSETDKVYHRKKAKYEFKH